MPTDTDRLNFLQKLATGYGQGWILRLSGYGRGWRLHETSTPGAVPDVRDAIDKVMNTGKPRTEWVMSRTTILKLWPGTTIAAECLQELSNSWGFAIPVWEALSEKYFSKKMDLANLDYLWPLYERVDVPIAQRAVLCMTFDKAYVSRKDFAQAAEDIRLYLEIFPPKPGNVDHWDAVAQTFESMPDCRALGFWATSVSDCPFTGYWNEAGDKYDPFDWEQASDVYELLEDK